MTDMGCSEGKLPPSATARGVSEPQHGALDIARLGQSTRKEPNIESSIIDDERMPRHNLTNKRHHGAERGLAAHHRGGDSMNI